MKKYKFALYLMIFTIILRACGSQPELPDAPAAKKTAAASTNTLAEIEKEGVGYVLLC